MPPWLSAYECDEGLGGADFLCVSASHKCMYGHTGRCAQRTYVNACVSTLVCVVTHRDIQMYERIECPNLKGELL
jgi:hypothetical protein